MRRRSRHLPIIRKRSKMKVVFFIFFSLLMVFSAIFLSLIDKRLLPTVLKIEEYNINSKINQALDSSVKAIVTTRSLTSSDFYVKSEDSTGRTTSLSVNTMLINEICTNLSVHLDSIMTSGGNTIISVPIGAILGFNWLANAGPSYKIKVLPMGSAKVDYLSSFTSVGINQINFQVWLTIYTKMQIINPLQTQEISLTRKIPLVNTVFSGEIPNMYFAPNSTNQ